MGAFGHYITRKHLIQNAKKHAEDFPQVVCFAFDQITHSIHLDGQYERDILTFFTSKVLPSLPQRGLCLDIGANIGNHTLAFAQHFDQVIAFEPHPRTYEVLKLNAALASNVTTVNVGLSSAAGQVNIIEDKLNIGASSVERALDPQGQTISFDLARLDDLPEAKGELKIGFVKLDIEGHEAEALRGAAATIARHKPVIMIEVLPHGIEGGDAAALKVLREMGYTHFYEAIEAGWLGRLPRKYKKLARSLVALFTGQRPSKAEILSPVEALEPRSYQMILCAIAPLPDGS